MTERYGDLPDRDITEPAHTITGSARTDAWVIDRRTNSKDGRGGMVPTVERSCDTPAPTLTSKSGTQWVLRHGNQDHACERTPDEPAATLLFGHALNDVSWVHRRPATAVMGDPRLAAPGDYSERHMFDDSIRLTVQEALVLQDFDADYPVQGSRTRKFGQIGNAIPVGLARAIVKGLL